VAARLVADEVVAVAALVVEVVEAAAVAQADSIVPTTAARRGAK
jgi:hypothetical protein